MKGSGNAAVLCREIIDQAVDLFRTHTFVDMGCNMVKNGGVQSGAFFDSLNLARGLK